MDASRPPRSSVQGWYTVGLLVLAYALSMLDRTILSLMIEPIQRDLGINDTEFGLLTGLAFALFYSVAGVPIGWLVDRTSRRGIIAVGITLWSTMTIASGMAASFVHLLLARIGLGMGQAALNPAAYSLIADIFPKEKLARAMGTYSTGGMVGVGAAFFLGGILLSFLAKHPQFDLPILGTLKAWQLVFVIAGLPGILLALLFLTVPEVRRAKSSASERKKQLSITAFVRQKFRVLAPLLSGHCGIALTTFAFLTWIPALFIRRHDIDSSEIGIILGLANGVFGVLGFIIGGTLADYWMKNGKLDSYMRVGLISAVLAIPFAVATVLFRDTVMAAASLCLFTTTVTMPLAGGIAGIQLITPQFLRGQMSAIFWVTMIVFGNGCGPLLVGLASDFVFIDKNMIHYSLLIIIAVFLPLAAFMFAIGRNGIASEIAKGDANTL